MITEYTEISKIISQIELYKLFFSHSILTKQGRYYYSQQLCRFILLFGRELDKFKPSDLLKLHSVSEPCIEEGLSKERMDELIRLFPDCLSKIKLMKLDEWKLCQMMFPNCKSFTDRYQQALDLSIKFTLREIKKYKLLGIIKCSGYARVAFNLLKQQKKRVLHITCALLSDLNYAYTKENSPMKTIERIRAHREVAIFDKKIKRYKVLTIAKCWKYNKTLKSYKYQLSFAKDEWGNDFTLSYPLQSNVGRKIFFPLLAKEVFVITKNGISQTPPKDFSTRERNNLLMSGNCNSNLCPKKFW